LPKAQYRSPKVFSSSNGNDGSNSLLPSLTNVKTRNNNMSTIQPPLLVGNGKQILGNNKPKSRLHEYPEGNAAASGGYEEEEFDSNEGGSPSHLK
jgi:hypothetical protein